MPSEWLGTLLSYLPSNNKEEAPFENSGDPADRCEEKLNTLIPDSPSRPYDMKQVLKLVMDKGVFFEIQPKFAPNILVGFRPPGWAQCGYRSESAFHDGRMPGYQCVDQGSTVCPFLRCL